MSPSPRPPPHPHPAAPTAATVQPAQGCSRRAWVLALPALGLVGCAPFNYRAPDSPNAQAQVTARAPRPRVALVLGSGGPRGYAHIGVLKVLEEARIEADMVVGSSVGALIAAFWAAGWSARRIEEASQQGGPLTLFDLSPFADRGWIRGQRLQDYVNRELGPIPIEGMKRRLVIVATRRDDQQPVFFEHGNVGVAVRASSAVPRVLSPVGIEDTEYEDADASLPVAVRAARQADAQFVLAVDVSAVPGTAPPGTPAHWLQRDTQRRQRIDPEVARADFLLHPDLGYKASPWRSYFVHAQARGEAHARARLPALLNQLAAAGLGS
jgi:NTE family protein